MRKTFSDATESKDSDATQNEAAREERSASEPRSETDSAMDRTQSSRHKEQGRPSKEDIPYIFRRDRVTDERTLHSYYLRDMVDVTEQDCRHEVQQQLGEEVPKADLREAALLVAYRNLDLIAEELREWGYDMD